MPLCDSTTPTLDLKPQAGLPPIVAAPLVRMLRHASTIGKDSVTVGVCQGSKQVAALDTRWIVTYLSVLPMSVPSTRSPHPGRVPSADCGSDHMNSPTMSRTLSADSRIQSPTLATATSTLREHNADRQFGGVSAAAR